ncbi:hypothetical protein H312_00958 [Anncaliia algerae PRA339]|uniref:Uncharacterized protein n=1 Tax=Anncaliia algerae PRA339 TaxID=1288291 RepID=A0A059F3S6_9MICR|nr:hypothetical protein H312_00958 [Anncaliia algerae PRA339]
MNHYTKRYLSKITGIKNYNIQERCFKNFIRMQYFLKRVTHIPCEKSTERILNNRQMFATKITNVANKRFIFIDAIGFNLHTSNSYEYSHISHLLSYNLWLIRGKKLVKLSAFQSMDCLHLKQN